MRLDVECGLLKSSALPILIVNEHFMEFFREKARELRKQKKISIREIAKILGISPRFARRKSFRTIKSISILLFSQIVK